MIKQSVYLTTAGLIGLSVNISIKLLVNISGQALRFSQMLKFNKPRQLLLKSSASIKGELCGWPKICLKSITIAVEIQGLLLESTHQ